MNPIKRIADGDIVKYILKSKDRIFHFNLKIGKIDRNNQEQKEIVHTVRRGHLFV